MSTSEQTSVKRLKLTQDELAELASKSARYILLSPSSILASSSSSPSFDFIFYPLIFSWQNSIKEQHIKFLFHSPFPWLTNFLATFIVHILSHPPFHQQLHQGKIFKTLCQCTSKGGKVYNFTVFATLHRGEMLEYVNYFILQELQVGMQHSIIQWSNRILIFVSRTPTRRPNPLTPRRLESHRSISSSRTSSSGTSTTTPAPPTTPRNGPGTKHW